MSERVSFVVKKIDRVLRFSILQVNSLRRRNPVNTTWQVAIKFKLLRRFIVISRGYTGREVSLVDSFVIVTREIGFLICTFVMGFSLLALSTRCRKYLILKSLSLMKLLVWQYYRAARSVSTVLGLTVFWFESPRSYKVSHEVKERLSGGWLC